MKRNKNEKGFFVIETIVVIAIVAIVVTYVFINFSNTYNRFLLSESYNNLNATNAALNLKEYVENTGVDYSATLGVKSYIEFSSISKVSSDYYDKLKDFLKVKTAYLMDTNAFYSNPTNLNLFDVKFQNYLRTLSKVKSKYIIVLELEDSNYGYIPIYNYNLELVGDPQNEFVEYVERGTAFIDPGYIAMDKDGNKLDAFITGVVDSSISGTYYLTYTLNDITLRRRVVVYDSVFNYDYTGNYQMFKAPISGTYTVELWGAQGGSVGGNGGFVKGDVYFNEGDTIYVYVGGIGGNRTGTNIPGISGYNGGGAGGLGNPPGNGSGAGGGGATDIRTFSGMWNNINGLRSRFLVAAGGGALGTSGLAGYGGGGAGGVHAYGGAGTAGALWSGGGGAGGYYGIGGTGGGPGGVGGTAFSTNNGPGFAGLFGIGGQSGGIGAVNSDGGGGGGGGYYGGGGGGVGAGGSSGSGGGGSSFVSGLAGLRSIRYDGTLGPVGEIKHYSGYTFKNITMNAGNVTFLSPTGVNETGHTGNGYARITLTEPEETNTLSKVRYIYNEMNGSSANGSSHWVELQAYDKNGNNVSQGLTSITNSYTLSAVNLSLLTDGDITTTSWIEGGQGVSYILLDLGQEYDLSSIRLWHYYGDGRTYYDNVVKVASSDLVYKIVLDEDYQETSYGRVIRPESTN